MKFLGLKNDQKGAKMKFYLKHVFHMLLPKFKQKSTKICSKRPCLAQKVPFDPQKRPKGPKLFFTLNLFFYIF